MKLINSLIEKSRINRYTLKVIFLLLFCSKAGFTSHLFEQDVSKITNENGKIVSTEQLGVIDKCQVFKIVYKSDSLNVVGFIVTPPIIEKTACIVFNRGGNQEFSKITRKTLQYFSNFAVKGYTVIASQYRGNDGGEGKEEFGGKDINDVLHLIPLIKSLNFINSDRIYMLGYSRGGMMTYLAIKHNVHIKAAAVVGGVTDLTLSWSDRDEKMKSVLKELIGCSPIDCPDEYKKRSAYYWVDKINVPLLIMHGELDKSVDVSQAEKLADKLKKEKYKLVLFPDGDHGLSNHLQERDSEILNWFETFK